jgi:hypothetical protein
VPTRVSVREQPAEPGPAYARIEERQRQQVMTLAAVRENGGQKIQREREHRADERDDHVATHETTPDARFMTRLSREWSICAAAIRRLPRTSMPEGVQPIPHPDYHGRFDRTEPPGPPS